MLTFYPSCLCCCFVDRQSLPQGLYACQALCQMSLIPLLSLQVTPVTFSLSPFLPTLSDIPILGPTTTPYCVWLTCSMSLEDLVCPSDPC